MLKGEPVAPSKRHIILDALRGIALLGICMANFPEFSLYSFLSDEARMSFASFGFDTVVNWLLYIFIDGKFYTIFSLLFGIGFSIILQNQAQRGANGLRIFYRRMLILALIGFAHLMLVWSGDILMLYALVGMILPLFIKLKTKTILSLAGFILLLPVLIDTVCQIFDLHPSAWIVGWQWEVCDRYGITEANFAYWLRDSLSYSDTFKFLLQGAIVRLQEFVDGNRYFKVLGLFMIGYCIGRHRLYADIQGYKQIIKEIALYGLPIGLILSGLYAWSAMGGHPLGLGFHSLIYFASVYLTSFGYIAVLCLLYLRKSNAIVWKFFSYPGRMALTNYIGQSAIGMIIFYGIGFGIGASLGLGWVELIVLAVYLFETVFSFGWLKVFKFGPLEWIWRCLTYGKLFNIFKA